MSTKANSKQAAGARPAPSTTGHAWDGIEEYNNPLPRWWLWTFYATVIWALIYTILYPAWPLFRDHATPGLLGYSTRAEVAKEIDRYEAMNKPMFARIAATPIDELPADAEAYRFAVKAGAAVFRTWCAQCHGAGAAGGPGFPNLLDDDWLWGGTLEDILTTVTHGIRSPDDEETRSSEMPAFGEMLEKDEIVQIAEFVRSLSGLEHDAAAAQAGAELFADNCAGCHGDDGTGMRELGAPNLTDAIWLKGSSREDIIRQITTPKHGVMPNWNTRLSEAELKAVTAYVHQLGGGE
ncbi:MAG: cytochrome-c oxidase, cbb3-type subunit III [Alphaproteobacteria bacterium]|nr:MAG: cytochrome-c oxidase, cbb3-type subunit III [Alphaproteobacteria bacterium]